MTPKKILIDSNSLFPFYLRDLLLNLAENGIFEFFWTRDIRQELSHNLAKKSKVTFEKLDSLISALENFFPDSYVQNYEHLIGNFGCADQMDEHVMAAAFTIKAHAIVTRNIKDFPIDAETKYGINLLNPDNFLLSIAQESPELVFEVIAKMVANYKDPKIEIGFYPFILMANDCFSFADFFKNTYLK